MDFVDKFSFVGIKEVVAHEMPKNCSIPGCTSRGGKENSQELSFYGLPKEEDLRHQWLVAIKKPITVSEYTSICSLHFEGGKRPKEHPISSVFPWKKPSKSRSPPKPHEPLPQAKRRKTEREELQVALCTAENVIAKKDKRIEELEK